MIRLKLYSILSPLIKRSAAKKNILLKWLRELFGYVFIPSKAKVRDSLMYLHRSGHSFELAFEGGYEMLETYFLEDLNLKNKIGIDIGACIGYYTLLLSKLVDKQGNVISFEPDATNFILLQKNIATNNLLNTAAFQLAVGDKNQKVFLKKGASPGQHTVSENKEDASIIGMINLDSFFKKNNLVMENVGYVKIDAEGCEFKVLQGMHQIIKNAKEIIIQFEFAPQHLEEQKCQPTELISFIKKII